VSPAIRGCRLFPAEKLRFPPRGPAPSLGGGGDGARVRCGPAASRALSRNAAIQAAHGTSAPQRFRFLSSPAATALFLPAESSLGEVTKSVPVRRWPARV